MRQLAGMLRDCHQGKLRHYLTASMWSQIRCSICYARKLHGCQHSRNRAGLGGGYITIVCDTFKNCAEEYL
jgi:hypothetical protein